MQYTFVDEKKANIEEIEEYDFPRVRKCHYCGSKNIEIWLNRRLEKNDGLAVVSQICSDCRALDLGTYICKKKINKKIFGWLLK